jgi:hypothetical protein
VRRVPSAKRVLGWRGIATVLFIEHPRACVTVGQRDASVTTGDKLRVTATASNANNIDRKEAR